MTTFQPGDQRREQRLIESAPSPDDRPATRRSRAARRLVFALLRSFRAEHLTIVDHRGDHVFGSRDDDTALVARAVVTDDRCYLALVTEGSVGLGRAYIERWWESDDPVAVLRVVIRNMEPWDRRRNALTSLVAPVADRVRRLLPSDSRERNRDDISAHYDLGNDFFSLFLDETLTYSSGVFDTGHDGRLTGSLADASRRKYDLLLGKAQADGHLIEIGTGWGGLALRAASQRNCRVTTTTISAEQFALASERVAAAGLSDRVELLDSDWRDLTGTYDHLVSIEMIEAVNWRDYDRFFSKIGELVRPGGRAVLQAIVLPDDRWNRAKNTVDFIRKFVFPNGYLPSVGAIESAVGQTGTLTVASVDDYTEHYAETLRRWRSNFDERCDEVRALGYDERFVRLWRFYLMYCESGFAEHHVQLKQITLERQPR